jgi:hypothetical protein
MVFQHIFFLGGPQQEILSLNVNMISNSTDTRMSNGLSFFFDTAPPPAIFFEAGCEGLSSGEKYSKR